MVLIEDTDKNQDHAFLERIVACFAERSRCLFLCKTPCTYARFRCGGRTPSINSQTSVELISGLELGSVEREEFSRAARRRSAISLFKQFVPHSIHTNHH